MILLPLHFFLIHCDLMKDLITYVRWLVLACVFAVPALVLVHVNSMFFPYITGKGFLFRVITEIAFGGWILLLIFGAIPRPRFNFISASILIFLFITAIANAFGVAPFKSFWSNFERMEGWVLIIHLAMYFVVASSVLNTNKLWVRFWSFSLLVSFLVGYGALSELGDGVTRIAGSTGNPIYLAVYSLFHIFIAFILAKSTNNKLLAWLYSFAILFNIVILWFTGTRGALLGLVVGIIIASFGIIVFGKKAESWIRKGATTVLIGVVLSVPGFFMVKDTSFVQNNYTLKRLSEISFTLDAKEGGTGSLRLIVWNMAWQGIKERPWLGWGQENFNYVFNKYYDPRMDGAEPWYDRAHSVWIDWLIAAGVLGFVSYVLLYFAIWIGVLRATGFDAVDKSVLTGLLGAYAVHNMFVFDHLVSYILFFSVVAWVYMIKTRESEDTQAWVLCSNKTCARVLLVVISVITVSVVYVVNYPSYIQNKLLIKAMVAANNPETIGKSHEYFMEVTSYRAIGTQEAREKFVQAAARFAGRKDVDKQARKEFVNDAIAQMQEQLKLYPNDARFPYLLGGLLSAYGEYEKAQPFIERALELSPAKISFLTMAGSNAGLMRDFETAYGYYKKAVELAPENDKAQKLLKIVQGEIKEKRE